LRAKGYSYARIDKEPGVVIRPPTEIGTASHLERSNIMNKQTDVVTEETLDPGDCQSMRSQGSDRRLS